MRPLKPTSRRRPSRRPPHPDPTLIGECEARAKVLESDGDSANAAALIGLVAHLVDAKHAAALARDAATGETRDFLDHLATSF